MHHYRHTFFNHRLSRQPPPSSPATAISHQPSMLAITSSTRTNSIPQDFDTFWHHDSFHPKSVGLADHLSFHLVQTSAWSSLALTSRTSCGGLVDRALRAAPLWPEVARCSWVPREGTPAPGYPAHTRHWPTGTNPSAGPLVVGWLTVDKGGGTSPRVGVLKGYGPGPQVVAFHGIGSILGICVYAMSNVCMSQCGPIPRLSLNRK